MTKQEYYDSIMNCTENRDRVKTVSELYGAFINAVMAKVISFADNADFIEEERRAFSYNEIMNASEEYGFDFKALEIIPFMDAYDNNLIVYLIADKKWAMFSMSDEVIFRKRDKLEEAL